MNHAPETVAAPVQEVFGPVREEIQEVEARLARELSSHWPAVDEILRYGCMLGGKRLRPALLLLTAKALGSLNEAHLVLATVIEMIHTATLVHDDVLDKAAMRRHLPTVNSKWGVQTSVLLGDYLFTHAFYLASTTGYAWACQQIGEATNRVCEGELQQTQCQGRFDLDEDEYFGIIDGKTAALTECACRLAAQVSQADDQLASQLAHYGRNIGLGFQIVDDLLDLCGQEARVGKSLGTDLAHGKMTLPWIRARRQLSDPEQRQFDRAWRSGDHPSLLGSLRKSRGVESSRQTAQHLVASALESLEGLPNSPARDALRMIAEFVVLRTH